MKNRENPSHKNTIPLTPLGRKVGVTALIAAGVFLVAPAFISGAETPTPAHTGNESKLLTPDQTKQLQLLPRIETTVQPGEGASDVLLRANPRLPDNSQVFQNESKYINAQGAPLSDGDYMLQSGQRVSVPQYDGPFTVVPAPEHDGDPMNRAVLLPSITPNQAVGIGVASH